MATKKFNPPTVTPLTLTAQKIKQWVDNLPSSVTRVQLVASGHVEQVILETPSQELYERGSEKWAARVSAASDDYAEAMDKDCRFCTIGYAHDVPMARFHWRSDVGVGKSVQLDGSLESLLAQNQQHQQVLMKLNIELMAKMSDFMHGTVELVQTQAERTERRNEANEQRVQDMKKLIDEASADGGSEDSGVMIEAMRLLTAGLTKKSTDGGA